MTTCGTLTGVQISYLWYISRCPD